MAGKKPGAASSAPAVSWWARRSLRARLTAATTVVMAVGMALAAVLLVWQVHRSLLSGLDAAVVQRVEAVAAGVDEGNPADNLPDREGSAPVVQVVSADGQVIAASDGASSTHRMFALRGRQDPVVQSVAAIGDNDGDRDIYRVAAVIASTRNGPATVYAALPTDSVSDSIGELTTALAVGVPLLIIGLGVVAWLMVGRALMPVEALRLKAASIPGTDLSRRLPVPLARDELARLATTLNDLLSRIEASAERQRQFVADAAHELRSPIASLRTQLEVAARHKRADDDTPEAADDLLHDVARLGRLTDDLLALAQLDANPHPRRQVLDFDDLVIEEVRRHRRSGVRIDATGVSAGRVLGDPVGLARVVRNLVDNATRHATSTVTVGLRGDRSSVVLTVADDGPGIAVADRTKIFERFTRLDEARSADAGGAGLGLAIVRDVAHAHGGKVRVDDNHPGAIFTVWLPPCE